MPRPEPVRIDDRTGVLHPENLARYDARRFEAHPDIAAVVDHFWQVRWHLDAGEVISQRIIDAASVHLTVEQGAVPAPLVITGVHRRAWHRLIRGSGSAFGIRLRPAGLAVVSDLTPPQIADATVAVTPSLDRRLHELMTRIAEAATSEDRVEVATAAIAERLAERPVTAAGTLANAILDALTTEVRSRVGVDLPERLGVSPRTIQRALKETVGHGPKFVSRRVRLQELARLLATRPDMDLAQLAYELGYADQAHLTNDFRAVAGISPGAYRRSVRVLAAS
ncbi:MAG TPA: helix-turn-helix domain-containing protein [Acidimicrobiia bacterium]|jgi:AraC-like DNA-binding protein